MTSFLAEVVEHIYSKHKCFDNMAFILPSRRAGLFLKQHIAATIDKPIFSPKIYSIEEFVIHISGLEISSNLTLLLELYEAFLPHLEEKERNFDSFVTWGATLLSDFNEIDRHLVDHESLFSYLTASQRLKNWGSAKSATPMIENTVQFWSQFSTVYNSFKSTLLRQGIGYQGLLYREAVNNIEQYIAETNIEHHHFIGFNALNTSEEYLFNEFLNREKASVWWDIDPFFLEDDIHEAGFFIRNHLKKWPKTKTNLRFDSHFLQQKEIRVTGVPKSISQAKFTGKLLQEILRLNQEEHISVILSDEMLLQPLLNSLPNGASKINITMGMPLKKTALNSFFQSLFDLHLNKSKNGWYYKDVTSFLTNPYTQSLFNFDDDSSRSTLNTFIKEKNILFITRKLISNKTFTASSVLRMVFNEEAGSSNNFIATCIALIERLKSQYQKANHHELHQLYGFFQLFNQLQGIISQKHYLTSLKSLRFLFNELVGTEKIDFKGEPLGGVQIMGILESRNLDFETVILTSVNEGILPAGKSDNSFIPYDIKREYNLPTYKEKDAIYAYHFYRLLQRAKKVHILYNTEPDTLMGGEKSRFITQLLMDYDLGPKISHSVAAPELKIHSPELKEVQKTVHMMGSLKELALNGFSPSSLSNYIRNPYAFYKRNVLRIKDVSDVEESIAHNTFGTIVHDSLEALYQPLIQKILTNELLSALKKKIEPIVKSQFVKHFFDNSINDGQNLIAFNVIKKYLSSFIDFDIQRSKNNVIKVLALEKELKVQISVSNYTSPVFLKGKLDRLEEINGTLQILDYKTGNTLSSEVEVIDLDETTTSDKKIKAFQF